MYKGEDKMEFHAMRNQKQFLAMVAMTAAMLLASCRSNTIDAATPQSFDKSLLSMQNSLDAKQQVRFKKDVALIMFASHGDLLGVRPDISEPKFAGARLLDGKNIEQIQLLADSLRQSEILDLQKRQKSSLKIKMELAKLKVVSVSALPDDATGQDRSLDIALKLSNKTNYLISACAIRFTILANQDTAHPVKIDFQQRFQGPLLPNKDTVIVQGVDLPLSRAELFALGPIQFMGEVVLFEDINRVIIRSYFDEMDELRLADLLHDSETKINSK